MESASIKTETKPNAENFQNPSQNTSYKFVIILSLELSLFDINISILCIEYLHS